jgi:hypothetical protein
MLNGVKKADRLERTITAVIAHADELEIFLHGLLKQCFKDYSENDLSCVWGINRRP